MPYGTVPHVACAGDGDIVRVFRVRIGNTYTSSAVRIVRPTGVCGTLLSIRWTSANRARLVRSDAGARRRGTR